MRAVCAQGARKSDRQHRLRCPWRSADAVVTFTGQRCQGIYRGEPAFHRPPTGRASGAGIRLLGRQGRLDDHPAAAGRRGRARRRGRWRRAGLSGRSADGLRREGEEPAGRAAADRRRGRRPSTADPTQLEAARRRAGWSCPQYTDEDAALLRARVPADADHDRPTSPTRSIPRQIDVNADHDAAASCRTLQESFARTMLALIAAGQPLTEAMTTQQFMMTPALDGALRVPRRLAGRRRRHGHRPLREGQPQAARSPSRPPQGPIPIAETLDPTSPNYMHWYDPDVATDGRVDRRAARMDPIVYPRERRSRSTTSSTARSTAARSADGTKCPQRGGTRGGAAAHRRPTSRLEDGDHPPARRRARRRRTFYDLPTLRTRDRARARRSRASASSARRRSSPTGRPTRATRCASR